MIVPWIMAAVTAVWFGLMARQAARSMTLWAAGGGFFALTVTTIIWGIGQAAAIPFSDSDQVGFHVRWTVEAFVIVVLLGWVPAFYLRGKTTSGPKPPQSVKERP